MWINVFITASWAVDHKSIMILVCFYDHILLCRYFVYIYCNKIDYILSRKNIYEDIYLCSKHWRKSSMYKYFTKLSYLWFVRSLILIVKVNRNLLFVIDWCVTIRLILYLFYSFQVNVTQANKYSEN